MRAMVECICTVGLLWLIVSAMWPGPRKKQAEADHKHNKLLDAIARLEHQNAAADASASFPSYGNAERALVLALGRVRDGEHLHPVLDSPPISPE